MASQPDGAEQDDVSFLRTNDFIGLCCLTSCDGVSAPERVALAGEGFGNRRCFIERLQDKNSEPPDISICTFVLEQALSVRALQEMISSTSQKTATQSGSRTLLYGHAVLLRHCHSDMYLSCLSSSTSADKLAFDVGLNIKADGESCWWTIHPASKQRSEGEKVRVGDDFILVSVSSERYLHIGDGNVIASFQQTLWTVVPVSAGAVRTKSLGHVFGADVLRFFHGDECLTLLEAGSENVNESVMYETGSVCSQARSLWRIQQVRVKWSGGFVDIGKPILIRHVTSGRYLGVAEDGHVVLLHKNEANTDAAIFCLRLSKDDKKTAEEEEEGMGTPDIKYGDSVIYVQHVASSLWLSYRTYETKKQGVGKVEVKQALMLAEGHMDDGFTFTRAQEEDSRSALIIRKCTSLFHKFNRGLVGLKTGGSRNDDWSKLSLEEVLGCLQDLIDFFAEPEDVEDYDGRQMKLKALRNRQNLFQEEGMIALVLQMIDQFSIYKSPRHFASYAGEDAASAYEEISGYLYLLLAAMIRGNRSNCAQFAQAARLDWLVLRLDSQQSSRGVLEVLHCVLTDSPEALAMISETHIHKIIALIDRHGRDPKVLDVLCSLCVGNGMAVRSNQNLICDNLLPGRDLLLQTRVVDTTISMRPNIYVGLNEGSAMFKKWYYEVVVDHVQTAGVSAPHVRVGWANVEGYSAYPGSGKGWGSNGVGDDMYSYGFDGTSLWSGGRRKQIQSSQTHPLQKGDTVGCCLDLSIPAIMFTLNGVSLRGCFKDFNMSGMFFPVVSMSAKVSLRFLLGGDSGRLRHGPPDGYAPVFESLLPNEKLRIEPCFNFGDVSKGLLYGPTLIGEMQVFVPNPIDTSTIQLPAYIENVRDKLAENIHELWAMNKIERGWSYGEVRNDETLEHPCLTTFERLPASERMYDITLAFETLRTLLALGCHITVEATDQSNRRQKYMKLSNSFLQTNGYKPAPLDLSGVQIGDKLIDLVDQLAENTHNVWARERIRQGWTYGQSDDTENKRSCHLVSYANVDDSIKKTNREAASETIRTLLAYGYNVEPPSFEAGLARDRKEIDEVREQCRIYRGSRDYAASSGKWYYEFELLTSGSMRLGWASSLMKPIHDIGNNNDAVYLFDGSVARKLHGGSAPFGKTWHVGDIIGCMLDLNNRTITFSMNGELMMDLIGQEIAFKDIAEGAYVPVFMLGSDQKAKVNFGQDATSLKYYTCCGLQEGYEPFCINTTKPMPLWFLKDEGLFEPLTKENCVSVTRAQKSGSSSPTLKLSSKDYGVLGSTVKMECIRLSLPVKCNDRYTARSKSTDVMDDDQATVPTQPATGSQAAAKSSNREDLQLDLAGAVRATEDGTAGDRQMRSLSMPPTQPPPRPSFADEATAMLYGDSAGRTPTSPDILGMTSDPGPPNSTPTSPIERPIEIHRKKKSPFSFFKKARSREPSPKPFQYGGHPDKERGATLPARSAQVTMDLSVRVKPSQKSSSEVSLNSEAGADLTAMEIQELEHNAEAIDDYYYGVRILQGQDPNLVYVGWFTTGFSSLGHSFNLNKVRHVNLGQIDGPDVIRTSISRKECYLVNAGELMTKFGALESDSQRKDMSGIVVGCVINVATGALSFTINGRDAIGYKYQVEPGSKLFPGAIFEPTCKDIFQFEIGRTKTALPLSSAIFRGGKTTVPQCPSRLDIEILKPVQWSRVPNDTARTHKMKLSDIKGWSMLCEESVPMMVAYIPEQNRCLDVLELNEHQEHLKFHAKTLDLYCAVCSHGNHKVAHEVVKHVNETQLMHAIKDPYLAGPLRTGFHNLLITLHLESHANIRQLTEQEYIISLKLDSKPGEDGGTNMTSSLAAATASEGDPDIMRTVPSIEDGNSIKPRLLLSEKDLLVKGTSSGQSIHELSSPLFGLESLKKHSLRALTKAVQECGAHVRDPAGGSNETLLVPVLKVIDKLLVMGLITNDELKQLLHLIDPVSFPAAARRPLDIIMAPAPQGLLQMTQLPEAVKLQLCYIFHHLCDARLRRCMESLFSHSNDLTEILQREQLQRYQEITQTPMTPVIAAKRTREFRCSPTDQMRAVLAVKNLENDDDSQMIPSSEAMVAGLHALHSKIVGHCRFASKKVSQHEASPESQPSTIPISRLLFGDGSKGAKEDVAKTSGEETTSPDSLQRLLSDTVIKWAKETFIQSQTLVREMFSLLYRQYDELGAILSALQKTYAISHQGTEDICMLLKHLGGIRALLSVQVSPAEEENLKHSLKEIMDNKVFFQHPDLMRALTVHETVMQLMVLTLNKGQGQHQQGLSDSSEMVVMCCRFLCYFCRTSRKNQQAMFEHLSYLLENSSMLLVRPSLRGSCPLDVAYSSLMDNNELALALRESDLERIAAYLSRAGVQANAEMIAKGYPDIGWDPVEGERFLDFLRFCVWVNGESVEENANLVVRLLIRRPECLGPALRGESGTGAGGLLRAMKSGITMSEQIAASRDAESSLFLQAMGDGDDGAKHYLTQCKYDFSSLPPENDEDYIDLGGAILNFYSTLADLLGRCAPSEEIVKQGRTDSLRARAILRSLITMNDLEGVLSLRFLLPSHGGKLEALPPGLLPEHKAAMLLFLERVYSIESQGTFFKLVEHAFLPDLRAATTLDTAGVAETDMALALNRYLCNSVLPLLTKHAHFFGEADHRSQLMDSTLHTVYRLSKCKSLTAGQFRTVSDFLIALTSHMRPVMMTKLLRQLTVDLPALTDNTVISLRMLTHHYERCSSYYGSHGSADHGCATEEEKRLTMILFSRLFDALARRAYDPELFSKALPCLAAIGCALSPDYAISSRDTESIAMEAAADADNSCLSDPVDTRKTPLPMGIDTVLVKFCEHYHDIWASKKISEGWRYGDYVDDDEKLHPNLINFSNLTKQSHMKYYDMAQEPVKAATAWGWLFDFSASRVQQLALVKQSSVDSTGEFLPQPVDLKSVTLSREIQDLVDRLAENAHNHWAKKKKAELARVGGGMHPLLVPYDILTESEKSVYLNHTTELFKFLHVNGYRVSSTAPQGKDRKEDASDALNDDNLGRGIKEMEPSSGAGVIGSGLVPVTSKRFAYSLLEKLLEYLDKAGRSMTSVQPSAQFSRRNSFSNHTEEIKFFAKVVLPLVEKYFKAHQDYFISGTGSGGASVKEKEMIACLFCKLAHLLRHQINAFGSDVGISVRCLVVLVQAVDAKSVVKNSPDIVRSLMVPFFANAAEDLAQLVMHLKDGRFSHVKGTISRGATSLDYVNMVLLPVLTALFSHFGWKDYGSDLLVEDIQLQCYRILNAIYVIGTQSSTFVQREGINRELSRHRPALGECVAAFATAFPVAFLEPHLNKGNKYCIIYGLEDDKVAEHSLDAHEILTQISVNVPTLEAIMKEIEQMTTAGGNYGNAPHLIEVTLPMLCSYLPVWYDKSLVQADQQQSPADAQNVSSPNGRSAEVTAVTTELMNTVLGNVLKLILNNIGTENAPWMTRIAMRTQPIIGNATEAMLHEYILPTAKKLSSQAKAVRVVEEEYTTLKRNDPDSVGDLEEKIQKDFHILIRDVYAFYPVLIRYVDLYRSGWITRPNGHAEELFEHVAIVFNFWCRSNLFKRSEHLFMTKNDIDNLTLIMPSQQKAASNARVVKFDSLDSKEKKNKKKDRRKKDTHTSLLVAAVKRLLPIGLNKFGGHEQELVQLAEQKMIQLILQEGTFDINNCDQKEPEIDVEELIRTSVHAEEKSQDPRNRWQKALYVKMGKARPQLPDLVTQLMSHERLIEKILNMARVLFGLHMVEHPPPCLTLTWKKVVSTQRKKAVMACFRMVPLHMLPRHKAINIFLNEYAALWLASEESDKYMIIQELTKADNEPGQQLSSSESTAVATADGSKASQGAGGSGSGGSSSSAPSEQPDPLRQFIQAMSRGTQQRQTAGALTASPPEEESLYIAYAEIMSTSCSGQDEEEDGDEEEEGEGPTFQEQEMQKQKLLFEQGRLASRAAAEMLLLHIGVSGGTQCLMVRRTIECGIALLLGGNTDIQKKMLAYLQEKKLVGFFTSLAGLMQQCSVLDLDAFERSNKAEDLGVVSESGSSAAVQNLHDADFTCKLFRFLQLLCEGHNGDWQNYLRTQIGNNTTVNIIICTVDYLLRIQESIMDFYWHYSGKSTIDAGGKANFVRAIKVAKQVFRTLTEYIQGPCCGNQLTLAHSRLWDAVSGFLFIFANMQDKLSRDANQLELLREFMELQKEMMIMLLSMLEGNVMNGPIGKQMVDTLVESSANFEMILKFFDIFLKMKDMTTSEAFLEYDVNKDGYISPKEFRYAMMQQKMYTSEEIDYIMLCVDANQDGKVDFLEFTERFHNPAKEIGFNVALLLTNLSEHMPNDPRLERFLEKAKSVLDYFEPYLGRIEIMGSSGRIERVYFEITQSHIDQWEKPQIKDSKRSFLHGIVNDGNDNEKIEAFVNFCEDTIFEMQHATSISAEEHSLRLAQAKALRAKAGLEPLEESPTNTGLWGGLKLTYEFVRSNVCSLLSLFTWSNAVGAYRSVRKMTIAQFIKSGFKLSYRACFMLLSFLFHVVWTFFKWIFAMMLGEPRTEYVDEVMHALPAPPAQQQHLPLDTGPTGADGAAAGPASPGDTDAQDPGQSKLSLLNGQVSPAHPEATSAAVASAKPTSEQQLLDVAATVATDGDGLILNEVTGGDSGRAALEAAAAVEEKTSSDWGMRLLSIFARNFYNFKVAALFTAFAINFVLLFYKVTTVVAEDGAGEQAVEGTALETVEGEDGDAEPIEMFVMDEGKAWMQLVLQLLALLHSITSFSMLVAYYHLKVPLVVFKREKCIARQLEFEGLWIAEQPGMDNLRLLWDKLVLNTRSFPVFYWDKFVKKKVRNKFAEQYDYEEISNLLGMEKSKKINFDVEVQKQYSGILPQFMVDIDWKYQVWKWGVILTDNNFLYLTWYLLFSLFGNYNHFFFAAHLMDVAISFKTLGTILQSVTHNGKQLVLTVMLTSIVVYLYTVIAFNFFRKFYIQEEDGGETEHKCHDMMSCFTFHLYKGVRAGGGIGDEIESPDGDEREAYRMVFDITFFFFVIVILLAIIQGLIIDAFGELRDQLEQVREDMESQCFICGIGKDYFDSQPRGFEKHVMKEHNFANYMFFLMHLINKPDTEHTGQESYVWSMYSNRCWDFFPVGDCFRKQYETEDSQSS